MVWEQRVLGTERREGVSRLIIARMPSIEGEELIMSLKARHVNLIWKGMSLMPRLLRMRSKSSLQSLSRRRQPWMSS